MNFVKAKKELLDKLESFDKSKKGSIDKRIIPVMNKINSLDDYYTTSSCSGRIFLLEREDDSSKHVAEWIFMTHELADKQDVVKSLEELPKKRVWFRQEGPILHIACANVEAAQKIINLAKLTGYKRAGAFNLDSKIIVEIVSSETIEAPISENKKLLVSKEYVEYLVEQANKKLSKSWKRLEEFEKQIEELGENR